MIIKTVQWNIGGGKIRKKNNPINGPYKNDGLKHVEEILGRCNADIITLQETHSDSDYAQAGIIANQIGLGYFTSDIYDKSHMETGKELGQAILSRFPIHEPGFEFFLNPHLENTGDDGRHWVSRDRGISRCLINLGKTTVQVATLHLIAFRAFGINPFEEKFTDKKFSELRKNISDLIKSPREFSLIQGDFNFDNTSLREFLPEIFSNNSSEVLLEKPTTPKNKKYDHIVFRGLKHVRSEVISDVLTDHFPVYSEFEIGT